jgi:hypothetical protein
MLTPPCQLFSVFRIRDILIRIRILGSGQWLTDPDPTPDPASFGSGFQDANKKSFSLSF